MKQFYHKRSKEYKQTSKVSFPTFAKAKQGKLISDIEGKYEKAQLFLLKWILLLIIIIPTPIVKGEKENSIRGNLIFPHFVFYSLEKLNLKKVVLPNKQDKEFVFFLNPLYMYRDPESVLSEFATGFKF
uniref:Uncharacterized protein n=2 Tax=Cacopsylla melanoneura TaxID=428564 RepID=A0A8D9ECW2_9HEMI